MPKLDGQLCIELFSVTKTQLRSYCLLETFFIFHFPFGDVNTVIKMMLCITRDWIKLFGPILSQQSPNVIPLGFFFWVYVGRRVMLPSNRLQPSSCIWEVLVSASVISLKLLQNRRKKLEHWRQRKLQRNILLLFLRCVIHCHWLLGVRELCEVSSKET